MKKLLLLLLLLSIIGCRNNTEVSEAIYELSGISLPYDSVLLAKSSDCCSFTGDGYAWFVYEVKSIPKHNACDFLGVYSEALDRVSAFAHYLSHDQVCVFDKKTDNGHQQVAIQGHKIMYFSSAW